MVLTSRWTVAGSLTRLHFEPVVYVRTATPQQLPKARSGVCHEEEYSPPFVLPDVGLLMSSQAVEFCLTGCEYDVTERDRVEGQRSKEKVGRFERGKCDFNSTVNHPGGGTEQKCWRHEAQTNRSAGRGPDIARDASSEVDTAHCEYLTTIRRNFVSSISSFIEERIPVNGMHGSSFTQGFR